MLPLRHGSRRSILHPLHTKEHCKDLHGACNVAAVVGLVHRLCQTVAFNIDPLPLRAVINCKLTLEDIAKERYRMRVPPGLLSWLKRDLNCCDLGGAPAG